MKSEAELEQGILADAKKLSEFQLKQPTKVSTAGLLLSSRQLKPSAHMAFLAQTCQFNR